MTRFPAALAITLLPKLPLSTSLLPENKSVATIEKFVELA